MQKSYDEPYSAPRAQLHDDRSATAVSSDDKTWAMLAHLLVFVAGFVGPLVIYLVKKDEAPYVAATRSTFRSRCSLPPCAAFR